MLLTWWNCISLHYVKKVNILHLLFILQLESNATLFFANPDESKINTESASFEVFRDKGTFGAVSVFWNITADNGANPSLDISPVSGVVNFLAGDSSKFLVIRSLPDTVSIQFCLDNYIICFIFVIVKR